MSAPCMEYIPTSRRTRGYYNYICNAAAVRLSVIYAVCQEFLFSPNFEYAIYIQFAILYRKKSCKETNIQNI